MRMERASPCGWKGGFHADGLWRRCSLFFFADPVDITILVVALERQRVVRPLWYNAYRWRRGFRRGKVDERAFM